jgi:hypothetical protein
MGLMTLAVLLLLQAPLLERRPTSFELGGTLAAAHFMDVDGDGRNDLIGVVIDRAPTPPRRLVQIHRAGPARLYPAAPAEVWAVPPEAAALIFGDHTPEPGQEICFLAADGIYVFPKQGGAPRKLIHARTFFGAPSAEALPVWSYGTDLDRDGRWDFVVPTPDGYTLYLQTQPGVYGRIVRLESGLPPEQAPERMLTADTLIRQEPMQPYALAVRRGLPRLFEADIDSNGTTDLVAFQGVWLRYYFQNKGGTFADGAGVAERVPTLGEETASERVGYVTAAQFSDIDADGNVDLVVTRAEGTPDNPRTFIHVHFGSGYGIFREDYRFELGGINLSTHFADVDGDGKLDLITTVIRADKLGQVMRAIFGGQVEIDTMIYRFVPERREFDKPPYHETVAVRKSDFDRGDPAARTRLEFTDWTGDGLADKIRYEPKGAMKVYAGRKTPDGRIAFGAEPLIEYALARPPQITFYGDLDGDGVVDALLIGADHLTLLGSVSGP